MIDRWRQLETINAALDTNIFPLFLYTPVELDTVCALYQNIRSRCLTDQLLRVCSSHALVRFVESNLHYACSLGDDEQSMFSRNFAGTGNVLQRGSGIRCTVQLRGKAAPGDEKNKCENIPTFYACAKKLVEERCSSEAVGVLEEAINGFGCESVLPTGRGGIGSKGKGVPSELFVRQTSMVRGTPYHLFVEQQPI